LIKYKKNPWFYKTYKDKIVATDLVGNVRKISSIAEKYTLYFGMTEENNVNVSQNKLRVDNENTGFPEPCWNRTVSFFSMAMTSALSRLRDHSQIWQILRTALDK
jgi:hypothetical protein